MPDGAASQQSEYAIYACIVYWSLTCFHSTRDGQEARVLELSA